MNKKRMYSILFLISLVLLINSIPFSLIIDNKIIVFIINIIIKIASIIYIIFYIKKENINRIKTEKLQKSSLKLLPLLLLTASNFIVVLIGQNTLKTTIDLFEIISGFVVSVGVGIIEELLFRNELLQEFLNSKNKLISLLYSSLIFGSIHLLNISSFNSIPTVLLQVCYTFYLGLLLGIIYIYTNNIILPIIFHILFNFINNTLVSNLFNLQWDLTFYLVNIIIGILIAIYIVIISFKKKTEKSDQYVS